MTSIKCFHCGNGNIWDLRFSNKTNNQPSWKCDNDENCNFSKRYGKEFSWASWQTMPSQIIRNESTEEKHIREEFKEKLGDNIVELYTHTTEKRERYRYRVKDYEPPQINFIDVDTTKDSIETSFSKIINNLNKLEKL